MYFTLLAPMVFLSRRFALADPPEPVTIDGGSYAPAHDEQRTSTKLRPVRPRSPRAFSTFSAMPGSRNPLSPRTPSETSGVTS
jgi:hypothetical protein